MVVVAVVILSVNKCYYTIKKTNKKKQTRARDANASQARVVVVVVVVAVHIDNLFY